MNLVKFNPMVPTKSVFEDFFEDFFNNGFTMGNRLEPRFTEPMVNISETQDAYKLELAVPGVKKEDIQLELDKGRLIISGSGEQQSETSDNNYSKKEFYYGSFSKRFFVPESVDVNKINASFKNGILSIDLKKKEEAIDNGPQQIKIK